MKTLEKVTVFIGLVIVGITAVYRHVLTDEQRDAFREVADVVRGATQEISDTVAPLVSDGPTRSEEAAATQANQERTAAQWEALGY